jgi:hypothetical protein
MWRSIAFVALAGSLAACGVPRDENGDVVYYQLSRNASPTPFGTCSPDNIDGCGGILNRGEIHEAAATGHLVFRYRDGRVARVGSPVQVGSQPEPPK